MAEALPLLPAFLAQPDVYFRCAHSGCGQVFFAANLEPRQGWWNGTRWFAPCGHEQTTHHPQVKALSALGTARLLEDLRGAQ